MGTRRGHLLKTPPDTADLMRVQRLDAVHALKLAGYTTTSTVGDLRMEAFDAANARCASCGRVRLWYSAWRRAGDVRHVGLACCPNCLHATGL